jgi:hypothetical protein
MSKRTSFVLALLLAAPLAAPAQVPTTPFSLSARSTWRST